MTTERRQRVTGWNATGMYRFCSMAGRAQHSRPTAPCRHLAADYGLVLSERLLGAAIQTPATSVFNKGVTMQISVVNHSHGKISDEAIQNAIRATNRQIAEDFAPYWGMPANLRLEGRS